MALHLRLSVFLQVQALAVALIMSERIPTHQPVYLARGFWEPPEPQVVAGQHELESSLGFEGECFWDLGCGVDEDISTAMPQSVPTGVPCVTTDDGCAFLDARWWDNDAGVETMPALSSEVILPVTLDECYWEEGCGVLQPGM
eukprot:CAMPEP_0183350452 /NCGR_PEP_ID=MMETSP0164_2-20130417/18816_1 /TAXON_ID=221442 /ORGANISM="Coccolithus pelagicus ssp braarudi, Strain PLY182g" /LENGTH=142 /DNA_ID=CAMNT_0025522369 /DNA_START=35 /DNA_END=463 /DNA_ORIENTATION=-